MLMVGCRSRFPIVFLRFSFMQNIPQVTFIHFLEVNDVTALTKSEAKIVMHDNTR
jgi:hypothetical protein